MDREKIIEIARKELDSNTFSHNFEHAKRVYDLAKFLAKGTNADDDLLFAGAMFHDIGSREHIKYSNIGHEEKAVEFLKRNKIDILENKIIELEHIILSHDGNVKPQTLEAKIIHDADKLDGIGAVGIARAFGYVESEKISPHYIKEMFDIKNKLFISRARRIANHRHLFMKDYFRMFQNDVNILKENNLIAIIPAAGSGSRLKPFPLPKELYPMGSMKIEEKSEMKRKPKPISQYIYESICKCNPSNVFFILGKHKEDIMHYYGNGRSFGSPTAYLFQEEPSGLAMAVLEAKNFAKNKTILFGMPDTYIEPQNSFQQLLEKHKRENADISLGLFKVENPQKFGVVNVENDNIVSIVDKPENPESDWVWGIVIMEDIIFDLIERIEKTRGEYQLTDVFDLARREGFKVIAHKFTDGKYFDMGSYQDLLNLELYLAKKHVI